MEKEFFVGIFEPNDIRRNVLESSKEIVNSLQASESLKKIRSEKIICYKKIKNIMDELKFLVARLEKSLPKSKIEKQTKKKGNKLEKLDRQLKAIEKEFLK